MSQDTGEGNIKIKLRWEERGPEIPAPMMKSLNTWRDIMFSLGMVGAYSNGIGYGNISARSGIKDRFYISGTGTGKYKKLGRKHYCLVTGFDIAQNRLDCTGPVRASAESMTHAAVYSSYPGTGAVFHIHHEEMWKFFMGKVPATPPEAHFGSAKMALALVRLLQDNNAREQRIAVMEGHEPGIIFWGKDTDEAGKYLLSYYNLLH